MYCIIGEQMVLNIVSWKDICGVLDVDNELNGTKSRTLGNTSGERNRQGLAGISGKNL